MLLYLFEIVYWVCMVNKWELIYCCDNFMFRGTSFRAQDIIAQFCATVNLQLNNLLYGEFLMECNFCTFTNRETLFHAKYNVATAVYKYIVYKVTYINTHIFRYFAKLVIFSLILFSCTNDVVDTVKKSDQILSHIKQQQVINNICHNLSISVLFSKKDDHTISLQIHVTRYCFNTIKQLCRRCIFCLLS